MQVNSTTADMRTLSSFLSKLMKDGYIENFTVNEFGLSSAKSPRVYTPQEVQIIDFFRFEGASDPDDNSILYALETRDGVKGTLTDAYGIYADPAIGQFIKKAEDISHQNK